MRYLSEDGKVFERSEECKAHEDEILKQKQEERENRLLEIRRKQVDLVNDIKKYESDFQSKVLYGRLDPLVRLILDLLNDN